MTGSLSMTPLDHILPLGFIGTVATASYSFGASGDLRSVALAGIGAIALVIYELKRKFKKEEPRSRLEMIERNIPRFFFGALMVPQIILALISLILEAINLTRALL